MQTYVVRRRGVAATAVELDAALSRLRAFEEEEPRALPARWIRSYALREADGRFGLVCVFEADSAAALQRHADLTEVAADEILPVVATLLLQRLAAARVYLVRRRGCLTSAAALAQRAAQADAEADAAPQGVSWLRSYAVAEDDGTVGTVCLCQADDPSALTEHAASNGLPADEIAPLIGPVFFRDDPREQLAVTTPAARPPVAAPRRPAGPGACRLSLAGHLALAFVIVAAGVHALERTVVGAPPAERLAAAARLVEDVADCPVAPLRPDRRYASQALHDADAPVAPWRASAC